MLVMETFTSQYNSEDLDRMAMWGGVGNKQTEPEPHVTDGMSEMNLIEFKALSDLAGELDLHVSDTAVARLAYYLRERTKENTAKELTVSGIQSAPLPANGLTIALSKSFRTPGSDMFMGTDILNMQDTQEVLFADQEPESDGTGTLKFPPNTKIVVIGYKYKEQNDIDLVSVGVVIHATQDVLDKFHALRPVTA